MEAHAGSCPLTERELIEEYFVEERNRVLELAAFLDRLDRARARDAGDDFRLVALRRALAVLSAEDGRSGRVERIQLLLSDPTAEPLDHLDRKGALGAYGGPNGEAR